MIKTVTDKLLASVVAIEDVERAFPSITSFRGRIAVDVRIEQGVLSVGKKVQLTGPHVHAHLEIVGIETVLKLKDSNVVRVICSRPATSAFPTGPVEGWTIVEQ
jgi:translation elongation factor EF-Tu-like GTPase